MRILFRYSNEAKDQHYVVTRSWLLFIPLTGVWVGEGSYPDILWYQKIGEKFKRTNPIIAEWLTRAVSQNNAE